MRIGYFVYEDTCRNCAFSDQCSNVLSQSGTWPIGSDIKNCNVRNILEYLYAKCMFTYIQLDVFKRVKVVPVGYFVHEDTCRNYAFSDQLSKVLSQSGTWPKGYDIRNVRF